MTDIRKVALRNRLQAQAAATAAIRGHRLGSWTVSGPRRAYAVCTVCGASLAVDASPPPNSIDIGGTAVALNCSGGS
jgi:hypothetical protein